MSNQTKQQLRFNRQLKDDKIKAENKAIKDAVRQTNKTNAQLDRKALLSEVSFRPYKGE